MSVMARVHSQCKAAQMACVLVSAYDLLGD